MRRLSAVAAGDFGVAHCAYYSGYYARKPMSHEHSHDRPSLKTVFTNFRTYDAPFHVKLGLFFSNNFHKLRTRSNCCGNHGQPGC